ncbi:MAG: hypothetical protein OXL97_14400 [Chloroflexota bacterium]|nr:hypothetical protein [Chloroflexota bacterium]MDE2884821.1 hypothetical protein [Chloroflexota bacterium]
MQYLGTPYDLNPCLLAIDTIVNSVRPPQRASLVTWAKDRPRHLEKHLFLFWGWREAPLTVVQSGFTSGYGGEGPRALSMALCMVFDKAIPLSQLYVNERLFNAVNRQRTTEKMLEELYVQGDPVEPWAPHYVLVDHKRTIDERTFWPKWHTPSPVFDFLDPELAERCGALYSANMQAAIREAYLVVEERLRSLMSDPSDDGHVLTGHRLIVKALQTESGELTDKSLPHSEREGLFLMFKGAYMNVRNSRAHRSIEEKDQQRAIELIYLADLLLRLLPR